ncbi:hypothetical protein C8J56DRAFT_892389 [Mycena floridula]|nr:hypothetical protein C8J56DRAFT_892389 [Mycena floridula]
MPNSLSTLIICGQHPHRRPFRTLEALEEHYRGSPGHPNCKECGRGFVDRRRLQTHVMEHHRALMHKRCPLCNELCVDARSFVQHVILEHRQLATEPESSEDDHSSPSSLGSMNTRLSSQVSSPAAAMSNLDETSFFPKEVVSVGIQVESQATNQSQSSSDLEDPLRFQSNIKRPSAPPLHQAEGNQSKGQLGDRWTLVESRDEFITLPRKLNHRPAHWPKSNVGYTPISREYIQQLLPIPPAGRSFNFNPFL